MASIRVLIADGQTLFAQALARSLDREPDIVAHACHASSGEAATRAALTRGPSVALLDVWLEGVAGPGAARTITSQSPGTRVIMLGWLHTREHVHQAFDAGAAAFVSKALPIAELADVIRRVDAGERILADPTSRAGRTSDPPDAANEPSASEVALTPRELEVVRLLGAGLPVEDVAARLAITQQTARTHVARVLRKTGTHSQLEAVAVARHRGYLG